MPRGRPRKACGAGKERVGLTCLVKCKPNETRCKKTNRCRTMKQKGKKKSSTISIVKSILENVIPSSVKKTRRGRPKASATSKKQKKDTLAAIKKLLLSSSSSSPKKKASSPIDEDKPFSLNFSFPSVPSLLKKEDDVESLSKVVPSLQIIHEASNVYKFDIGREENMFHFKDHQEQKAIIDRLMKEDKEWFEDQQFSQHDLHKLIQAYEYFSLLNLQKYFPKNRINLRALAVFKAGLLPTKYNRWKLV